MSGSVTRIIRTPTAAFSAAVETAAHLRIDGAEMEAEAYLLGWSAAAEAERFANLALLTQPVTLHLDAWPDGGSLVLPVGPVQMDAACTERGWIQSRPS